jgi:tetratricopeptide (TPR) repeat protein
MRLPLDDEQRWQRVRDVLAEDPFSLVVFVVEVGALRAHVLKRLRTWSIDGLVPPLVVIEPASAEQRLFDELAVLGEQRTGRFGVLLHSLERVIAGDRALPALQDFNFGRDSLPRMIRGPLVMVVSQEVVDVMRRSMGDFYSTRTLECLVEGPSEAGAPAPAPTAKWRSLVDTAERLARASQLESARDVAEQALRLAESNSDERAQADSCELLGDIAFRSAKFGDARSLLVRAAEHFRTFGARLREANCLHRLGTVDLANCQYPAACLAFERAADLYRAVGDDRGTAHCLHSLGVLRLEQDDRSAAQVALVEALRVYRSIGDRLGEANSLHALGAALLQSDHETARGLFEQALALQRANDNVLGQANCLRHLAEVAIKSGHQEGAREQLRDALPLFRRIGDVRGEAACLLLLGYVALQLFDFSTARSSCENALALLRGLQDPRCVADALLFLAQLPDTPPSEAAQQLTEAASLYNRVGLADRAAQAESLIPAESML